VRINDRPVDGALVVAALWSRGCVVVRPAPRGV